MVVPFLLKRKRSLMMQNSIHSDTTSRIDSSSSKISHNNHHFLIQDNNKKKENNNSSSVLALVSPLVQPTDIMAATNMMTDGNGDGSVTPRMGNASSMVSPCHYSHNPLKTPNPLTNLMCTDMTTTTTTTTNTVTPIMSSLKSNQMTYTTLNVNGQEEESVSSFSPSVKETSSFLDEQTTGETRNKKQTKLHPCDYETNVSSSTISTGDSAVVVSSSSPPEPICVYELTQETASALFQNESISVLERDEILNAADWLCQLKKDTRKWYFDTTSSKRTMMATLPQSLLLGLSQTIPIPSSSSSSSSYINNRSSSPRSLIDEDDDSGDEEYSLQENDFFLQVPKGSHSGSTSSTSFSPVPRQTKKKKTKRLSTSECDEIVNSIVNSSWKSLPTVLTNKNSSSSAVVLPSSTVPSDYPNRLALPNDKAELNSLHCFVRAELLELFVVPSPGAQEDANNNNSTSLVGGGINSGGGAAAPKRRRRSCSSLFNESRHSYDEEQDEESEYEDGPVTRRRRGSSSRDNSQQQQPTTKKSSLSHNGGYSLTGTSSVRLFPGRVGLRCVHCAHLPREKQKSSICESTSSKASMPLFYPKSLNDLYRSVCTWQRVHFRNCPHIPNEVRERYWALKEGDRTRGKTKYWLVSAKKLGLVDSVGVHNKGGIQFSSN